MCTIIIVDDDIAIRETLADNLRGAGHSVLLAMNGTHALELLHLASDMRAFPCIAVLDLAMPVMNGWELLAALGRERSWRKLQVIVSSGSELRQKGLPLPKRRVLVWPKPVQLDKWDRIQDQCPVHADIANSQREATQHSRSRWSS